MEFVYGLTFLLVLAAANPGPQFGIPKIPLGNAEIPKTPLGNAEVPILKDALEWTKKIQDLVDLTRTVLTSMGQIALSDNPDVGARIVKTLNGEIERAVQILADYSAKVATTGRLKRSNDDNGKMAYNDVGGVLVGSHEKTKGDSEQLSPEAQEKYYQEYKDGVRKCPADPCVDASKELADADKGKRKG